MRKLKRADREAQVIGTVCEHLELWDAQVNHEWRLSDCILLKFNLIDKRQVRRNKAFARSTPGEHRPDAPPNQGDNDGKH